MPIPILNDPEPSFFTERREEGDCVEAHDMVTSESVAKLLLEICAFVPSTSVEHGPEFSSPIGLDCKSLTYHPVQRRIVAEALMERIKDTGIPFDIIVAIGLPAIPLATLVAECLRLPLSYVRPAAKSHGKGKQIEGRVPSDCRALLISDVMSSGINIRTSVEALRRQGARVVCCLSILGDQTGMVERYMGHCGIPLCSLVDIQTVLNVAQEKKMTFIAKKADVQQWLADPEARYESRQRQLREEALRRRHDVATVLLEIGAITLSPEKPYRFTSGVMSPIYTDNRLLMSYPEAWKCVLDILFELVVNEVGVRDLDLVAGVATSGITHAAYLAHRLALPMTYVEASGEGGETENTGEDVFQKNKKALLVEDLISTGASAISAAQTLRRSGAMVEFCVALFSYDFPESKSAFQSQNLELLALSDLEALLAVAEETERIKPSEKTTIRAWAADPHNWGASKG